MPKIFNEIWVIVVLVLIIVSVHIAPHIAPIITTTLENRNNITIPDHIKIDLKTRKKINRKYYKIFESWQLSNILDKLNNSEEIKDNVTHDDKIKNRIIHGNRHGNINNKNFKILVNNELKENIESMINWENDHLIYFIKAENGHSLDPGQLVMMNNLNGVLREVKSIWYIFVNLDWKFDNRWIFKDHDKDMYYAPENNTIIEFDKNCKYEWSPLDSETPKYFILVYNFM